MTFLVSIKFMKKQLLAILITVLLIPTSIFAISVGWERLVVGSIHPFYSDRVLIGATSTTTNNTLEVIGSIYSSATGTFMGNVGIGTTSQAYLLDVYGSVRLGTSTVSNLILRGLANFNNNFYIDTSGNVATGTWQGTAIADAYIPDTITIVNNATTGTQTMSSLSTIGTIISGIWNGTAIADANVADDITLTNITQITNRALSNLTGTLNIASTTIVAGRSLTLSGSTVDADAELYTKSFSLAIKNATTTSNPAAQHSIPTIITITKVKCSSSSGTTTIQFDERGETTPWTAGTDVMNATLGCGISLASTTAFANAGIAADAWISLDIDAVTGGSTSTSITVYYTLDD